MSDEIAIYSDNNAFIDWTDKTLDIIGYEEFSVAKTQTLEGPLDTDFEGIDADKIIYGEKHGKDD